MRERVIERERERERERRGGGGVKHIGGMRGEKGSE